LKDFAMSKYAILMRHGEREKGTPDLTELGQQQVKDVARQMIESGVVPDVIAHSPLPRTVQTASIIRDMYKAAGHEIEMIQEKMLTCENSQAQQAIPQVLLDLEGKYPGTILAVTHGENVEYALSDLTKDGYSSSPGPATAVEVESEEGSWRHTKYYRTAKVPRQFNAFGGQSLTPG
jgi:broad specificity phosphatase PhoE